MTKDEKTTRNRRLPAWLVGVGTSLFVLVLLLGITYGFYAFSYSGEIFPGTSAGSILVSGLSQSDAEAKLTEQIRTFEGAPLTLTVADTQATLKLADLDVSYDAATTAAAAYHIGRDSSLWRNIETQLRAVFEPTNVPLTVTYNQEALTKFLDDLSKRLGDDAHNAGFEYNKGQLVIIPEQSGNEFDRALLETTIKQAITTATLPESSLTFPLKPVLPNVTRAEAAKVLALVSAIVPKKLTLGFEEKQFTITPDQLTTWIDIESSDDSAGSTGDGLLPSSSAVLVDFNRDEIAAFVKTIADDVAQEAVDAKLTITNGKATVFAAAQDGRALEQEATVQAVLDALMARRAAALLGKPISDAVVKLAVTVTKPTVTSSTVEDLGIKELIGTGTTDFSGSPNNRVHNINTGTRYLNGWLIKPGDEFSTVKALGAVDGSTGYLPELVIKENKTIPEFGGGLCQVSTTLFRSVMNAGLPITERLNHSYRVSYYERGVGPGLDATVYLPRPDFRFKNDTPGWILVQGTVKGNSLTFELYGTSDGRTATIDGPHTLSTTSAPPTVYETNPALAPGEQREVQKPHAGASTSATYTVKRGGEVINQQTFQSKYKAIAAVIQEGPKADAAPAPEPMPEPAPAEAPPADQPAQP